MRILYLDIDSLRPDHLGCYGYHRATSPAMDRIARDGVVFEQVYTPDAPCLPSRTALYSGRFGIQTGVVGHGGTAAQPKTQGPRRAFTDSFYEHGLAHQLQVLGFHTAMISPFGQRHSAWHFYAGFNEMHNTGKRGMESAEEVQPTVEKWLQANAATDHWFLHVNYWDPHTPYRVPLDYGDPFKDDPLPAWLDDDELIRRHNAMTGPHTSQDVMMYTDKERPAFPRHPGKIIDRASMRRMIDGYDTAVRYVDDQIAKIVASLEAAGVYDDTLIIISADHGESLGELGIYGDHSTADVSTCRVPMIVKHPGGMRGTRDTGLHYSLDLAPTLMELLGGQSQPIWDGHSFAASLTQGTDTGRDDLVLSQCTHVCQRAVRWEKWLYIRTYHDGFHLFPREMLFDVERDPFEQADVAQKFPEVCHEAAWRLARWHDAQMAKMAAGHIEVVDPLWTVIAEGGPFHARLGDGKNPGSPYGGNKGLLKYLERLEATGRADGAKALRKKYAAELAA